MSHMRAKRVSSRDAICSAGLEVLSRNPGASLNEIAIRAGVGRATLHRHFASRDDLMRELALMALDETDRAIETIPLDLDATSGLMAMFEALVPLGARFGFLANVAVDEPEVVRRYAAQVDGLSSLVDDLRSQGQIAVAIPQRWAIELINGLIWMSWSLVQRGEVAPRAAAELATRTALRGLGD